MCSKKHDARSSWVGIKPEVEGGAPLLFYFFNDQGGGGMLAVERKERER
jgi:hypothetical protein